MVTEAGVKETRQDRLAWAKRAGLGRTSALGATAGVLVAYAAFAVLVGVATAVVAALGIDVDLTDREWRQVGTGAAIAAGGLLFLAYLFGGYVSGRMARRAGLTNGLLVFIGGLAVAGATVGIVQATGESGEALDRLRESLRNFGVPTSGRQWGDIGTVAGIATLAGMLLGAVLGGGLGERWHAKVARAALDTQIRQDDLAGAATDQGDVERDRTKADSPVEAEEGRTVAEAGDSEADGERVDALEQHVETLEDRIDTLQASVEASTDSGIEEPGPGTPATTNPESTNGRRNSDTEAHSDDEDLTDLTKAELYQRAQEAELKGRSQMTKDELVQALDEDEDQGEPPKTSSQDAT